MAEAATKEPSMEDILSSIRKIIAEEETAEGGEQPEMAAEMPAEPAVDAGVSMEAMRPAIEPEAMGQQFQPEPEAPAEPVAVQEPEPVYEPAPEPASEIPAEAMPAEAAPAEPAPTGGVSLADIAASLQAGNPVEDAPQQPIMAEEAVYQEPEPVYEAPVQAEEPVYQEETVQHVEMVEETAHHEPEHVDMAAAVPAPTSEDIAREEEAFRGALMSPSVDGAVTGSFDRLKRSAMDDIEAKTEAILRPMLREWLDENLPSMVEKLVREEIERVARG